MRGQAGFFDVDERLKELSAKGDQLERLSAIVDFELFRPDLEKAVPRSDGAKGDRPSITSSCSRSSSCKPATAFQTSAPNS
jgi:hypothetical protein